MAFATWMDLEIIILSEVRQKDKYHMLSLICGIKKMIQMNLFISRITDTDDKLWLSKGKKRVAIN